MVLSTKTIRTMTLIKLTRMIAIAEGISYLLLAVTMPLKYSLEIPQPNYYVGMAHGLLFIAYISIVILSTWRFQWRVKQSFIALAASLIPFGTFYADVKIFKPEQISTLH
ncbi:MAG: integral membrane protein [Cellvibrionaceae bacterium]